MTTRRTMLKTSAAAAFALTAVGTQAAPASATPAPPVDTTALQEALNEVASNGAAGVLAEVRYPGGAWRGSAGVARLGTNQRVSATGRFRIGSVTKMFVSTVVLQLVDERRLGLDDTIERWLPGLVPGGTRITVRHLLGHSSGLFNYSEKLDEMFRNSAELARVRFRSWQPRELLDLAFVEPPVFEEPGVGWAYSNTNYIVLGLLIRRITGRSHADEIERRLLRNLRLHDTTVPGNIPFIVGPHAHGYVPDERDGQVVPLDITVFNPSIAGAAGDMISDAEDLNRFVKALITGRLLSADMLQQMQTVHQKVPYGLGIEAVFLPGDQRVWGHFGDIFGYASLTYTNADGTRQFTLSGTPWGEGNPNPAIDRMLLLTFAADAAETRAAGPVRPLRQLRRDFR